MFCYMREETWEYSGGGVCESKTEYEQRFLPCSIPSAADEKTTWLIDRAFWDAQKLRWEEKIEMATTMAYTRPKSKITSFKLIMSAEHPFLQISQ